jgi:hypothetical protein
MRGDSHAVRLTSVPRLAACSPRTRSLHALSLNSQLKTTAEERSQMARQDGQTNLAEAATASMEFTTLGRLTGAQEVKMDCTQGPLGSC